MSANVRPVESAGVELLDNPIKHYDWGSRDAIARLLGRPAANQPEAELWMGAHPAGSSCVVRGSERLPLVELIASDPVALLGREVNERFGPRLPFLIKLLAADRPLSIQAHPTAHQARCGFEAEESQNIPSDAERRNYKDPHHKPELIVALEPFEALSGFRSVAESRALIAALGVTELETWAATLADNEASALGTVLDRLLAEQPASLLDNVVARCRAPASSAPEVLCAAQWVVRLAELCAGDSGALAPLFLNYVRLERGEAMFIGPGCLHAYLRGFGLEVMGSSDNVLRGGLTRKHIDRAELQRVVRLESGTCMRVSKVRARPGEYVFSTPAEEFELAQIEVNPSAPWRGVPRGPEIWVNIGAAASIATAEHVLHLPPGHAAFVAANCPSYEIVGSGALFRCAVP